MNHGTCQFTVAIVPTLPGSVVMLTFAERSMV